MGIKEILIFSVLLNLDLFFASLSWGTRIKRKSEIQAVTMIITLIQSILPLIGLYASKYLGPVLGEGGSNLGAVILIITGCKILRQTIKHPHKQLSRNNILLIYVGAGIEGLFAGVSLGALKANILLFMPIFVLITYLVNFAALRIGSTIRKFVNISIDSLVGIIIIVLGVLNLLDVIK